MSQPPSWVPHEAPGYDVIMRAACSAVLGRVFSEPIYRAEILDDPRILHRDLFSRWAPEGYEEYAGTYRGTIGTSLATRSLGAAQLMSPDREFSFEEPQGLPAKIEFLLSEIRRELVPAAKADSYVQLLLLTHLFCHFGKLHPFLDGNGHIQRTLFAVAATEIGVPLSSRFAIHPRSYDRLLAWPLELFTRALPKQQEPYLAMVAEYVSNWLSGPFDAPASGIPPE